MTQYWTTKDGTEIPYEDLETSHLKNILALIKKRSKGGIIRRYLYRDDDDVWYNDTITKGKEFLKNYDYYTLLEVYNKKLKAATGSKGE